MVFSCHYRQSNPIQAAKATVKQADRSFRHFLINPAMKAA
jgi:hypothetical protein